MDVDDSPKLKSDDFEDLWADFESKKESKLRKGTKKFDEKKEAIDSEFKRYLALH